MSSTRPATSTDADCWVAMRGRLWPDQSFDDLTAQVRRFFAGAEPFLSAVFIAENPRGSPIGFIELNLRPYAEGAEFSPVPHIEGWYVEAGNRRRGVGRALVEAAETWARAHGFRELTSDTTDEFADSPAAHRKLGFVEVERLIAFRKALVPPNHSAAEAAANPGD